MRAIAQASNCAIGRRGAIIAAIVALMFVTTPHAYANTPPNNDSEASAFIDHLGKRVITLLSNPKKATKRKIKTFRKIFTSALDMRLIAKQVLGRHWRTAPEEQRKKYIHLFSEYVVQIYLTQFSSYSGESFDVLKEQASAGEDRMVKTRVIRDNGEITYVDFRVRHAEERFRVVDVAIRGVSLLVAKRSEFDAIIRRRGLNGLIEQLEHQVSKASETSDPFTRMAKETFRTIENIITFGNPIISDP